MNVYDSNLLYLMSDMLIYAYDFGVLKQSIKQITETMGDKLKELLITITAKAPSLESPLIERFTAEGKLRSFQTKELLIKVRDAIKNGWSNSIQSSLNRFARLKQRVEVSVKANYNDFKATILFKKALDFSNNLLFAVIHHFNTDSLGYCDNIRVNVKIKRKNEIEYTLIEGFSLPKLPVSTLKKIVTLQDKEKVMEFYQCPEVLQILKQWFFPHGLENDSARTEVTYDALREDIAPQKRRKVLLPNGEYENLHDAITPYTTMKEWLQIIEINDILGIYPSVRTAKAHNIVTAVIDIDVSGFLLKAFSRAVIWELIIAVTEEIVKNLTETFGLPHPLVAFSGSRGVHITYRLAPNAINSDLNYLDYSELYLLPSQKSLAKNAKSLIHSKFTFVRSLMQAVLLYTAYNFPREVLPKVIRERLGIPNLMDLFTLSVFSKNKIGILLDTSSNNSSVYRVFSIHPTTGLVSIPLIDPKTKKIKSELKRYSVLKEMSKPETIISEIKSGNQEHYFQFPPTITKKKIKYLLRPDKLLSYLSVIIKFSDKWATERNPWSMKFWLEMYKLNNFYDYLTSKMLSIEHSDKGIGSSYQEIIELVEGSEISTKNFVKEVLDDYFFRNISYKALKTRLNGFHDLNFYASFKFTEITTLPSGRIDALYSDIRERKAFFHKFCSFFNVTVVLLTHLAQAGEKIEPRLIQPLVALYEKIKALSNQFQVVRFATGDKTRLQVKKNFVQIVCAFNVLSKFIKEVVHRAGLQ